MLSFFFRCYGTHRDLHSFPTRRSSDLGENAARQQSGKRSGGAGAGELTAGEARRHGDSSRNGRSILPRPLRAERSEEHTSELQSRFDLVCRLLLEKKKNRNRKSNERTS